jgi:uncharacterized membrane protein YkvI
MLWFKKYLLPGLVFQSVLIGGGYGTGRELVEFFMSAGPISGYPAMLVSTILISLVMMATYELARMTKTYDYKSFLTKILGKGSVAYEILYIPTAILTVSVMVSAAGELSHETLGIAPIIGSLVMMALVALVVFQGGRLIEQFFSVWSIALYTVYIILIAMAWSILGDNIQQTLAADHEVKSWFINGVRYTGYNIITLPVLLYSTKYIETRKEAFSAGFLGGLIGMIPAILIYTAMLGKYPEIITQAIPANFLMNQLDIPWLNVIFQIILFGTFIETGVGNIHGFNERIAAIYQAKGNEMPALYRIVFAGIALIIAVFFANAFGLIGLISDGYGMITWGGILIYVIPLLTVGIYKIFRKADL